MSGLRGVAVGVLLVLIAGSGACSDGEEPASTTGAPGGSNGSAGSGAASDGSSGTNGASGSSGAGGLGGSADGGVFGDLLDRMAGAYCEAIFKCAELRKDFIIELLGGRDRCPTVVKQILQSDLRNRERMRELASGSLRLDNDALEECLSFQRSCALAENDIFQPCREALDGSVARGGSCRFDDECDGDAYCAAGSGAGCPGTCVPRQPAGSPCRRSGDCAGRYARCVSDSTGMRTCRELTLVEGIAIGAPCGDTSPTEVSLCSPELWCGDGGSGSGQQVCRALIEPGGACQSDFEVCAAGHFCNNQGPPGSCQPVTIAREGEPCSVDALAFCDYYGDRFCVAGRCELNGNGDVGTLCGTDLFNCNVGLHCDSATDTCQRDLAAGEPCTSRNQCSSGSCGSEGLCAAAYCGL